MTRGSRAHFLHLHPSAHSGPSREDVAGQLSPASPSGTSLLLSPPDVLIRRPWNSHLHSWAAALPVARWTLELSAEATGLEPGREGALMYTGAGRLIPPPLLFFVDVYCPDSAHHLPPCPLTPSHLHMSCLLWQPELDGECPPPSMLALPKWSASVPSTPLQPHPSWPSASGELKATMQATGNM